MAGKSVAVERPAPGRATMPGSVCGERSFRRRHHGADRFRSALAKSSASPVLSAPAMIASANGLVASLPPRAARSCSKIRPVELGSTWAMRRAGCEIVVGDRAKGAFPDLTVRENLFADAVYRDARGWPSIDQERQRAAEIVILFGVRPRDSTEARSAALAAAISKKFCSRALLCTSPRYSF